MAQVEMTSPFRARTIRSLSGHTVRFERNETKKIPAHLLEEAITIGLVPSNEVDVSLGSEPEPKKVLVGSEREQKIREAIQTIQGRSQREDWAGSGNPSKDAVTALIQDKVGQREVNAIFKAMKEEGRDN